MKIVAQARAELDAHNTPSRHRHRTVRRMADTGMSSTEIAAACGITRRAVDRLRAKDEPPGRPTLPDSRVTDERAAELEDTAHLVTHLAFLLRDEDPNLTWGALCRLSRRQLQEFAVVALAAIPVEETEEDLYRWVTALPAARAS